MRIANLILRMPGNWVSAVSTACDASVKVLKCVPGGNNIGHSLLRIETSEEMDAATLLGRMIKLSPACQIELNSTAPGEFLATVTNNACELCGVVAKTGCFLDSASSRSDGRVAWKVIAPDSKSITELVSHLKSLGGEVEMVSLHSENMKGPLTYHQEKIIRIAYDLGYFDIPRRLTLNQLASRLGLTKSTLNIILRRAERKLIEGHIGRP